MQFHLNGFRPGDPELSEAAERGTEPPDALPDEVDALIVVCGPAGLRWPHSLRRFPRSRPGSSNRNPGRCYSARPTASLAARWRRSRRSVSASGC
jgi:phenol 2-monooxygenase